LAILFSGFQGHHKSGTRGQYSDLPGGLRNSACATVVQHAEVDAPPETLAEPGAQGGQVRQGLKDSEFPLGNFDTICSTWIHEFL
jgi:hypothetical protein